MHLLASPMPFQFDLTAQESSRAAAHRQFAENAARAHERRRAGRLKDLRARRRSIGEAVKNYRVMDDGNVPTVHLRSLFVRLASPRRDRAEAGARELSRAEQLQEDWDSRPPCMQLIRRASNAQPLYLTAIYLAQLEARHGGRSAKKQA